VAEKFTIEGFCSGILYGIMGYWISIFQGSVEPPLEELKSPRHFGLESNNTTPALQKSHYLIQ
jgi:hypothetical protein